MSWKAGADIPGGKVRDEIGPGLRTLHIARHGQRGRHFLIYLVEEPYIRVLRILHDGMDLSRHLPPGGGTSAPDLDPSP